MAHSFLCSNGTVCLLAALARCSHCSLYFKKGYQNIPSPPPPPADPPQQTLNHKKVLPSYQDNQPQHPRSTTPRNGNQRPTLSEQPAANRRPTLTEQPAANRRPTLAELQRFTVNGITVNIIHELAYNWKNVCIAFNFDPAGSTLQTIEQRFPNRPEDCCREMFHIWMKTKGATWMCLVTILENAGEGLLATFVKDYALLQVRLV